MSLFHIIRNNSLRNLNDSTHNQSSKHNLFPSILLNQFATHKYRSQNLNTLLQNRISHRLLLPHHSLIDFPRISSINHQPSQSFRSTHKQSLQKSFSVFYSKQSFESHFCSLSFPDLRFLEFDYFINVFVFMGL